MNTKTRIGFSSIVTRPGSVELPEKVTLFCPQCKTKVANKGDCIANFRGVPDDSGNIVARIAVDCRNCGCYDEEAVLFFAKQDS